MEITKTRRLIEKYPDARFIGLIVKNISNLDDNNLEAEKRKIEVFLKENYDRILKRVEDRKGFLKKFGKISPVEFQLKTIANHKSIPRDFALKDILFMTELKHSVIMSCQDFDDLNGKLVFDLSIGSEEFLKIDNKKQKLKVEDIILKQGDKVLISHLYGPGYTTRVKNESKNALYLIWLDYSISDAEIKSILADLKKYLKLVSNSKTEIEEVEALEEKPNTFIITPWEVKGEIDYKRLTREFGTEPITDKLLKRIEKHTGKLHHFLTRKIFFSHRDMDFIIDQYEKGNKFALYTGRGPSGTTHIGHLIPWIFTKWLQDKFDAELYFQIVDDEKFLVKDLTLEQTTALGYDNVLDVIALGFDPKKTKIIINTEYSKTLYKIALKVAKKINFSQAKAVFGFTNESNIGIIFYTAMQAAPCFLPSTLKGKNIPVLIPAAIDQDAYWRGIAREVAPKLGYYKPAQIHCRFLQGLEGAKDKMSSSLQHTAIYTTDTPQQVKNKIMRYAFSGGRDTTEEHRRFGGNPDIDVSYQWLTFFEEDDKKLQRIYDDYKSGKMLTGELKQILIDKLNKFLAEHQKRREDAKKHIEEFMLRD